MDRPFSFCIRFCDITVRFVLPTAIQLPDSFAALRCADVSEPDEEYRVQLLTEPLRPAEPLFYTDGRVKIFQTEKGWLRIYPVLGDEAGCQVACLFCPDGVHTIYYPASRWESYSKTWHCAHLICGELLLLRHNSLLLHSSIVRMHGRAVLFSGPSGAGKSTQAALWNEHLGADILNGDRTVIMQREDGFYGGGSIWSGTSRIFRPEQAPIAGIFLVQKDSENRVKRLHFDAFAPLFSQTIVNSWDPTFMRRVTELFSSMMTQIPVYRLYCRPDQGAVEVAYHTLFGKEPTA